MKGQLIKHFNYYMLLTFSESLFYECLIKIQECIRFRVLSKLLLLAKNAVIADTCFSALRNI